MSTLPSHTARNLLFHLVASDETKIAASRTLSVTALELGDCIEAMRSSGLRPASLEGYLDAEPPGGGAFTLSFDDAHPSLLEGAAPVIEELGVSATVFVPAGYVGESDEVMSWRELRALAARPEWTVGSHGATHQRMGWRLYDEDDSRQLERLTADALRSRLILERGIGVAPRLFAYPFGEAPAVARRAVADAGFEAAFTVAGSVSWDGDLLGVPRLDGNSHRAPGAAGDGEPERVVEISVIVPTCDRADILREVVRRLSEQSYPEERYEVIIVDDGSGMDLRRELSAHLGERVRLLSLEGSDDTFRAGQARQAGADAARFDVLVFLDADVAVDKDYLWHVAYCHGVAPGSVVLGYLSGYNLHDLGHVHGLDAIAAADRLTGDLVPVIPDRGREPALRACLDDVHRLAEPWRLAYTGNLSVSAELLTRAGGFADAFEGWGFEDIDLGVRLHEAGARWVFSRWALGYHVSDRAETGGDQAPRNPFRDRRPSQERFTRALENLATLEARHRSSEGVAGFCAQVRADVEEICRPPEVIGVEVGAAYPFEWPFPRLHKPWPGELPLQEILERLAYAAKLGATALYLLGGDVALRPELPEILAAARAQGVRDITIETTALPLARDGAARRLTECGLTSAVVEVLAGRGHPTRDDAVVRGVSELRRAGVPASVKLVLGDDDRQLYTAAMDWVGALGLPLGAVVLFEPDAEPWIRSTVSDEVEIEVVAGTEP